MDPALSFNSTSKKFVKLENQCKIFSSFQNPLSSNQLNSSLSNSFKALNNLATPIISNLLPSHSKVNKLDIYNLFMLYSNLGKFYINIPTTMIKDYKSQLTYIISTKKNGRIYTRNCHLKDFFLTHQNNNQEKSPNFCIKSQTKNIQLFYSIEAAENAWKNSKNDPILIQKFINCCSSMPSITRVLWRDGDKNKYVFITSTLTQDAKLIENKKNNSQAYFPKFRHSHTMLKTKNSHNNPFCHNKTQKLRKNSNRSSTTLLKENKWTNENINDHRSKSLNPCKTPLNSILDTKTQEEYFTTGTITEIREIDDINDQIVIFLNKYFCKNEKLRTLISDFIYSKDGKWVFLDIKDYSTQVNSPTDNWNNDFEPKIISPHNKRSLSEGIQELLPLDSIRSNTPSSLPFKMKRNPNLSRMTISCSDKDLFERCSKLSQKIDYLTSLKPARHLNSINSKEESIKHYQMILNHNSYTNKSPKKINRNDEVLISCPIFKQKSYLENSKNILHSHKVDGHAQRHLLETNNNLDEMKIQCEILKVKRKDLIQNYGGDEFWNQFIMSLYKKVIESKALCKHFIRSNLNMIIRGMLRVFNGNATLEFRRTVRTAHQNLKISENEFDEYYDIFDGTLKEFHIEEDDRQMIMSQIRSMKCLICK